MAIKNEHLTARDTPISVGDTAPDFTLMDQDKGQWKLSEHIKRGDVALCFYPMDFSPVCSSEMKCVTEQLQKFEDAGTEVVGVSCDSFFTHKAYADQQGLRQTLLADMHREVCKAYGFFAEDLNCAARGTVLIAQSDDGKGKVKWVQARDIPQAMDIDELVAAVS